LTGARVAVFQDWQFDLEWVLAPGGTVYLGLSDDEAAAALRLSPHPLLTLEEMRPALSHAVHPFLIGRSPLTQAFTERLGVAAVDAIGPSGTALLNEAQVFHIARECQSALPTEMEWEYSCRAGTRTLFWFGDDIPSAETLPGILGLEEPATANGFGLSSLFFGEWCSDHWRRDHSRESAADASAGRVIKGGGARFWPWHDDREWSGCVSAFRMPSKDTGGAGAAARLVRRPI
jgi:formylglycine-generating enzyme required for sulfatase activity